MKYTGRLAAFVLVVVGIAAAPARASSGEQVELVLRTRMEDAAKQARWGDVVAAFLELRRQGLGAGDLRLLVRYAQAQVALNDPAAAEAALVEVLDARPDDVVALPLLARLRAERGELTEAGDLLVLAARAGRLVLRDLTAEPARSPLRALLSRPGFVLRVMTAAQGDEVEVAAAHDPFVSRLEAHEGPVCGGLPQEEGEDAGLVSLRQELEALFARVVERARARDLPAVERAFGELRATLPRLELQVGVRVALEELERARGRFAEAEELFAALRTEVLLHEGNGLIARARAANDAGDWGAALDAVEGLEGLAERLRGTGRARDARLGEAFLGRAREIAYRARTAQAIAGLRLEVTGIVLPPDGDGPRRAIVNDRIHAEGERVFDPATGEPLEDVWVVEIRRSVVRFRYRDVEFARGLQSRP